MNCFFPLPHEMHSPSPLWNVFPSSEISISPPSSLPLISCLISLPHMTCPISPSLIWISQSPLPPRFATDSNDPPSLESTTEFDGPPSLELTIDSVASQSHLPLSQLMMVTLRVRLPTEVSHPILAPDHTMTMDKADTMKRRLRNLDTV